MRPILLLFLVGTLCFANSCYDKPAAARNPWQKVNLVANGPIRSMHSAPIEVLAITDQEFFRINTDNEVIEEREIGLASAYFGRPALGDWVFARFIEKNNKNVAELHLVRGMQTRDIDVNALQVNTGASIDLEGSGRDVGAFNEDATQLAFPVRISPSGSTSYIGVVLANIELTGTKENFIDVNVQSIVSIPELSANAQDLSNIRFLNGNYYIMHKDGAFRITPGGNYNRIASGWTLDVFQENDQIYLTSYNDFDFFVSNNNGTTFERTNTVSPAKYVSRASNQYFNQINQGFPFKLLDDNFDGESDILYNTSIMAQNDNSAFWNMIYMGGRFYINVQKEVYYVEQVELEE